jgi:chromosome segregation ATPase
MLKVKVTHLKTALREAEDKIETLEDEGEDLRKENAALLSDDDYMEDEGNNGYGQDKDEDEEDLTFINGEPEDSVPLPPQELTVEEEDDPAEPPFEDDNIILYDD